MSELSAEWTPRSVALGPVAAASLYSPRCAIGLRVVYKRALGKFSYFNLGLDTINQPLLLTTACSLYRLRSGTYLFYPEVRRDHAHHDGRKSR